MPKPVIDFNASLKELNPDCQAGFISQWIMHPGMLFGSRRKWWADFGRRNSWHEGLDFCLFQNSNYSIQAITPDILFPLLMPGKVAVIIQDLLAQTILVRHPGYSKKKMDLYSIYAHVRPLPELNQGSDLSSGQPLCRVPGLSKNIAGLRPHLHLSLAWIAAQIPIHQFSWTMLNQGQGVYLEDPLHWMSCKYRITKQLPWPN